MIKEAIILAGGLGTRLRSVVSEQPKSMAPINGKPFLEYLLDLLIDQGIERFIFSVGYKSEYIQTHFSKAYRDCEIAYAFEEEPLGTGGAIKNAFSKVKNEYVLITNGDSLFATNIQEQFEKHLEAKADVSFSLKPMRDFERYGTVLLDSNNKVLKFEEKQPMTEGLINGGVYIFNKSVFNGLELPNKFSIEKDFFEAYINKKHLIGYISDGYFLDIGIPEDFAKAQDEFKTFS